MNQNKMYLLLAGAFALIALGGCGGPKAAPPAEAKPPIEAASQLVRLTPRQFQNTALELGRVTTAQVGRTVRVNGVLDVPPENMVSVSAPLGGFLKSTHLLPGERVRRGQVIAQMEHPDYIQLQQDYLDSRSRLAFAKLEYERQAELSRENVNAAKVFQQTTTDYQVLQHRVSALAEKLALINVSPARLTAAGISRTVPIVSPIDGYVKVVNVNLGKYVNPSDVMFELVNTSHMHIALSVFERDIAQIQDGQRVTFNLPNETGDDRQGVVHLVGKTVGADKTSLVHVHLLRDDPKLLPGMYVSARVETGDSTVQALPAAAVVESDGKHYLFAVQNAATHVYRRLEVVTGEAGAGRVAVRLPAGFDPNTPVVTRGAATLLAKMTNADEE